MDTQEPSEIKSRGKVDWERVDAATRDEIDATASAEIKKLGLSFPKGRRFRPAASSPVADVRVLRDLLRMSQSQFADQFGLSLRTIQQWEQGRAKPDQPARLLLRTIEIDADAVARAASVQFLAARGVSCEGPTVPVETLTYVRSIASLAEGTNVVHLVFTSNRRRVNTIRSDSNRASLLTAK